MVRPGSGAVKRSNFTRWIAYFDIDRDLRHQRHAVAARHHLHDRRQAGGAEAQRHRLARGRAIGERLVAQAMAFLQQNQPLLIDPLAR